MSVKQFRVTEVDGKFHFHEMTENEIREENLKARVAEEQRIKNGGCDHKGDWVHDYDPASRLGDAYYCAKCGELMQVG
jgi:hypothetical protein